MAERYRIPDGQSVVFDAVRIGATMAVFLGHATRPAEFSDAAMAPLGRATIPIFLMLSGYMTAMAMSSGGRFARKVLRRYLGLYFIVVPAVLVLLAADLWLVAQQSPIVGNDKFLADHSARRILREAFEALTFSGEYWRLDTTSQGLFANQAFWTIDYIMAYVVLTAAFYLLVGWQRVAAVLAVLALAGPTVALLAPLWLFGVAAFEIHRRARPDAGAACSDCAPSAFLRRRALPICLAGLGTVVLVEQFDIGERAYLASKEWAWQWMLAPGLFAAMLAAPYLIRWRPDRRVVAFTRRAARHMLPIYMLHFSALYVAQTLIPDYRPTWRSADPYLMMAIAMAATLALSYAAYRFVKPAFDGMVARIA